MQNNQMNKGHQWLRMLTLMLFSIFVSASMCFGEESASTHISFGQYTTTDGDDTVTGSRLSISYIQPLNELWSYYVNLSNGSASGKHVNADNTETKITSNHTNLGSGVQLNFNFTDSKRYVFFIGSGLLLQSYDYDYDYPESETGTASGIGYGYTAYLGFKFRVAKNIVIIPGYHYEQVMIKTESDKTRKTTTAGTSLALAVAF